MTPLAHQIAKQLTLPIAKRVFHDEPRGLLQKLCDAHCFESTKIMPLLPDLLDGEKDETAITKFVNGERVKMMGENTVTKFAGLAARLAFLPAPATWIEWTGDEWIGGNKKARYGWLLVDDFYSDGPREFITCFSTQVTGCDFCFSFPKDGNLTDAVTHGDANPETEEENLTKSVYVTILVALLALINTPKIIGRQQHMPHIGLQRALAHAHGGIGKYPLQAWTEIRLEVGVPQFAEGEHEARLSGAKALHFCRAHLRLRNGRVEFVRAHWRGDPAVGIKRSRYRLEASH